VCLLPGTDLAFENYVRYDRTFSLFGKPFVRHRVARFRQVNVDNPNVHHDALEFPGGQFVMVTRLTPGQRARVLQSPAALQDRVTANEGAQQRSIESVKALGGGYQVVVKVRRQLPASMPTVFRRDAKRSRRRPTATSRLNYQTTERDLQTISMLACASATSPWSSGSLCAQTGMVHRNSYHP
jgi:hypothetical protein